MKEKNYIKKNNDAKVWSERDRFAAFNIIIM